MTRRDYRDPPAPPPAPDITGRRPDKASPMAREVRAALDGLRPSGAPARAGDPPLQPVADRALIRVDLLRLAHRHDVAASDIVERARAFEAYVFGDQAADKP